MDHSNLLFNMVPNKKYFKKYMMSVKYLSLKKALLTCGGQMHIFKPEMLIE